LQTPSQPASSWKHNNSTLDDNLREDGRCKKQQKKSDIIINMEIVNEKYPSRDGKGN
jgi:hypothetical protein